jgi:hypothetical protein
MGSESTNHFVCLKSAPAFSKTCTLAHILQIKKRLSSPVAAVQSKERLDVASEPASLEPCTLNDIPGKTVKPCSVCTLQDGRYIGAPVSNVQQTAKTASNISIRASKRTLYWMRES